MSKSANQTLSKNKNLATNNRVVSFQRFQYLDILPLDIFSIQLIQKLHRRKRTIQDEKVRRVLNDNEYRASYLSINFFFRKIHLPLQSDDFHFQRAGGNSFYASLPYCQSGFKLSKFLSHECG